MTQQLQKCYHITNYLDNRTVDTTRSGGTHNKRAVEVVVLQRVTVRTPALEAPRDILAQVLVLTSGGAPGALIDLLAHVTRGVLLVTVSTGTVVGAGSVVTHPYTRLQLVTLHYYLRYLTLVYVWGGGVT